MNDVVVEKSVSDQLRDIAEPAFILDSYGNKIGVYFPRVDAWMYKDEYLEPLASDEELRRRMQMGGGRSLKEILADLEKRAE